MEENLTFHNKDILLKGTLTKPDLDKPCPVVIVTHTSHAPTRDFGVYQHLAELLPSIGIAVFIFDRRGSGESIGDFETASLFDLAGDTQAAIDHIKLRDDIDPNHLGVWGMSQGGWIAPLTAVNSTDIAFVVAVSSVGVSVAEQMNYSAVYELRAKGYPEETVRQMLEFRSLADDYYRGKADRFKVQEKLEACREEAWFPLAYLNEQLPEDPTIEKWHQIMDFDPLPIIQELNVPTLLLYAEEDPWVPIAKSIEVWKENGPKDLAIHQIKDANHFMISIAQAGIQADKGLLVEEYSNILIEWFEKQLA
jgi:pimeloyl-ACP methyl ester carboxylesterase